MGQVAQLYGLDAAEAMKLTDVEAQFMLEQAQIAVFTMATTSPEVQAIVRSRLEPTLRAVRNARNASGGGSTGSGGVGAPN